MTEVSVETNPAGSASPPIPLPPDVHPAELAAVLPERLGEEYLLYERAGQWVLASGVRAGRYTATAQIAEGSHP